MEEKMTIHRGLSELKLLDARIEKGISQLEPVAPNQKNKKIGGYLDESEYVKNTLASWQSVIDLIKRKSAIKSAIVASNAKTMVKVGGKAFTVADAITFKTIIESKTKLASHLRGRLTAVAGSINKGNEQVNKNVDALLVAAFNGADNLTKATKESLDAIRIPYLDGNNYYMVDPLKVQEKIDELEKETSEFKMEVDAILSESNAVTFINV